MGWFTRDPDAKFWAWFTENQLRVLGWQANPEAILASVSKQLEKVHKGLVCELGPTVDGVGQIAISADGNRELFPIVERLVAAAPPLPRWRIIAFRPRRPPHDIRVNGRVLDPADVRVIAVPYRGKVGVTVLIPGYDSDDSDQFDAMAFILLDQVLGEYMVETRLGFIDILDATEGLARGARPLTDLPRIVDDGEFSTPFYTAHDECVWTILQGEDDVPVFVRRNESARLLQGHPEYVHRVAVGVDLLAPNELGLPTREENERLHTLQDALCERLEKDQAALLVSVLTAGGKKAFVFYTRSPEATEPALREVRAAFPAYAIAHTVEVDPDWRGYHDIG